ncbi:unnamed protein product [Calypogeia fissa]
MRRGGGGRPDGSDGSDYAYRMTVDDRYRRAAQGKVTLRKYLTAQTVFQLLKVSMTIASLLSGDGMVENLQIAACVFGVLAVLIGTLGLKRGASKLIKAYIFLMSLTVGLSLVPLTTGNFYEKMSHLTIYKATKDHKKFAQLALEGVQEIMGSMVGVAGISVATNLVGYMSPPKRREGRER